MEKPRIVFVFHSENLKSGATRSLMDIVTSLVQNGKYEIDAIFPSASGSAIEYLNSIGVSSTYGFKYGNLMQDLTQPLIKRIVKFPFMIIRFIRVRREAAKAAKILKDRQYNIVYSNTSSIVFGGYLGLALNTKQMWHIREFRIKDHRIKFFLGESWIKRFINTCAQKVLFVSKSVMDENTDIIDPKKCIVTYNSYDNSFIDPKSSYNEDEPLNILLAGDIKPSKGQLVAVDAIALLKEKHPEYEIKLYLAGGNSNKEYYQTIINHINCSRLSDYVELLGHVSDMKSLREHMDVGIVSSDNEAFGRTTIEGMLSSLAMIGRNSGGTTEQIRDGQTGFLYDGSVEDLASKIEKLYLDRVLLKRIAVNGFEEAVQLYTNGRCAKIVDSAIQDVLNCSMS